MNKPEAKIFVEAMRQAGADRKSSLMIGDSLLADIIGARNVGMDQVFFNPHSHQHQEKVSFEIKALSELPGLLL